MELSSDIQNIIDGMGRDIDKMRAIIYAQQILINSQEGDIKICKSLIGILPNLYNSNDELGIIINNPLKLVMSNFSECNLLSKYPNFYFSKYKFSSLYHDIKCKHQEKYSNDLTIGNIRDIIIVTDMTIDGFEIRSVCCSYKCIIVPKSKDITGFRELFQLQDKLVKANRIEDKLFGILSKKCDCS
jgi:hypothetical protein